jgi:hypothetical protein
MMKKAVISILVFLFVCLLCAFALKSVLSDERSPASSLSDSGSVSSSQAEP